MDNAAERRLSITQAEILAAMADLVEGATDTVWLTDGETVFERLAYLYETAGGDRADLVARFPEYFE
ncbi:hypothetical protein [Denitromonas halophila]|uniref:Uncharacterized protein n=1 Tax=Denitromonas halophila TaxID=1629404 RepID=A0A557QXB2_9RHOO|nr:hypothetical protein [Denitromonas halophila]TVO57543.1 hypothetical protein FHP91_07655 [Denitromonas halophila]